jgi:hypothetical protein
VAGSDLRLLVDERGRRAEEIAMPRLDWAHAPGDAAVWASADTSGRILFHDGDTELGAIEPSGRRMTPLIVASDGKHLAAVGSDELLILDRTSRATVRLGRDRLSTSFGKSLVFSANGEVLLGTDGPGFIGIDTSSGRVLVQVTTEEATTQAAISGDARVIASGDVRGKITFFSIGLAVRECGSVRVDGEVTALAFSPAGRLYAAASDDTRALVFDVPGYCSVR